MNLNLKLILLLVEILQIKTSYKPNAKPYVVIIEDYGFIQDSMCTFYLNLNVYKKKNKTIYSNHKKPLDANVKSVFWKSAQNKYYKFLANTIDGRVIEEGYWDMEVWHQGYYRFYHLNGKMRKEGVYHLNEEIGRFFYYNDKEELIKIDEYPDRFNILGTEKKYPKL